MKSLSLAALVLLLLAPAPVLAAGGLLGATLTTTADWVEVQSLANVPTDVTLTVTKGDYRLSEAGFPLDPGQAHRVSLTGTGEGQVLARQTAAGATGDSGAVELVAWIARYPDQPPQSLLPLALLVVGLTLGLSLALVLVLSRLRILRRRSRDNE